jgi:cytochrome c peroxidase
MQSSLNVVSGYKPYFEKAYPGEGINPTTVSKAIATYERGVISGTAPFDRWINGDEKAISESAKRGFLVFNEAGKCTGCHKGWNFTDHSFHDIGVTTDDEGRFKILPLESMKFAFKTPTLRNVAERGPYMHNGSEKSLEEVVELYNLGGKEKRPSLSKLITPLNLTIAQKTDLINFLKTLTSKDKPVELPLLPL